MPNLMGRVFNALSNQAEIKQIKGIGYLVLETKIKRTRRTAEEMKKEKAEKN